MPLSKFHASFIPIKQKGNKKLQGKKLHLKANPYILPLYFQFAIKTKQEEIMIFFLQKSSISMNEWCIDLVIKYSFSLVKQTSVCWQKNRSKSTLLSTVIMSMGKWRMCVFWGRIGERKNLLIFSVLLMNCNGSYRVQCPFGVELCKPGTPHWF